MQKKKNNLAEKLGNWLINRIKKNQIKGDNSPQECKIEPISIEEVKQEIEREIRQGLTRYPAELIEMFGLCAEYPDIIAIDDQDNEMYYPDQKMRLTSEDNRLIKLIEAWGYLTVDQTVLFMGYKQRQLAQWRLQRLYKNEFITRSNTPFGKYIYTLKNFKNFDIAGYEHNQIVKRLAYKISQEMSCEYETEKQLRSAERQEHGGAGLTSKIPDFALTKDGKKVAIEVELTQKSIQRQRENIEKYMALLVSGEYVQVFYYCGSDAILTRIRKIISEKGLRHIQADLIPDEVMNYGKKS